MLTASMGPFAWSDTIMAEQHDRNYDEISRRAYRRFEERGGGHGNDQKDWFEAEREVRNREPQISQPEPAGRPRGRESGPGSSRGSE